MVVTGSVTAVVPLGISERTTLAPPSGASSLSTSVPVENCPGPAAMVGGLKKICATVGGGTVSMIGAVCELPPDFNVAVIVTVIGLVTASVVTGKPMVVLPAGTSTDEATWT